MSIASSQANAQVSTTADEDRATAVLTLAFSADPACRWAWPNPDQYLASFPTFIRGLGGRAFEHGTAYGVGEQLGVALWLPPGVYSDEDALVELFQRTVSEERQDAVFAVFEQMGRYHPHEPHWYLSLIGVDPSQQGAGHGSTLLRHALAACDRDGLPAYLESTNPRNTRLYARHGFEAVATIQVGDSPPIVPMIRQPQ